MYKVKNEKLEVLDTFENVVEAIEYAKRVKAVYIFEKNRKVWQRNFSNIHGNM